MDPQRWSRIKDVFEAALPLGVNDRERMLREKCADDGELRREVESLLRSHEELEGSGGFLEADETPDAVGPYRILRPIARGGMGVVYLAEQTEPIRRQVAVKLIKIGMDTREVVARFRLERQALALMSHPYIANVIDAGSTTGGRPYFVMEYVPGVPITDCCDSSRLDVAARLDLFLKVCDGVQHAHQKGVIHRDIKPSNVLVQRLGNELVPKIIDFGVAKSTGHQIVQQTSYTRTGALIGTPEYLSPEQASLTEASVDTRTDVYSLGVLLFELLTGLLPFGRSTDPATPFDEILRRVRTEEAPRPSARLAAAGAEGDALAPARRADRASLVRLLRRDLDWIVLRALEKDPARRYASVSALADDTRRHLQDLPVEARANAAGYSVRLFVRRHRFGVLVLSAAVAALALVAVLLAVQARRIAEERDVAAREAATAQQVTAFLVGLFDETNPNRARNREMTAVEIVDQGADRIRTELAGEPRIRAEILQSLGRVYLGLDRIDLAEPLLQEAVSLVRAFEGEDSALMAKTHESLALVRKRQERLPEAIAAELEAIAIYRRIPGDYRAEIGRALADLANLYTYSNRIEEALEAGREADRVLTERYGERNPSVALARSMLGQALRSSGDVAAALDLHRQALDILLGELKRPNPLIALAFYELGNDLALLQRHEEAEPRFRESIRDYEATLPPVHRHTANAYFMLGQAMFHNGRGDEGVRMMIKGLEIEEQLTGTEAFTFAAGCIDVGTNLASAGHFEESEPWLRKGLVSLQSRFGNLGGHLGEPLAIYVDVLRHLGRQAEADRVQKTRSVTR